MKTSMWQFTMDIIEHVHFRMLLMAACNINLQWLQQAQHWTMQCMKSWRTSLHCCLFFWRLIASRKSSWEPWKGAGDRSFTLMTSSAPSWLLLMSKLKIGIITSNWATAWNWFKALMEIAISCGPWKFARSRRRLDLQYSVRLTMGCSVFSSSLSCTAIWAFPDSVLASAETCKSFKYLSYARDLMRSCVLTSEEVQDMSPCQRNLPCKLKKSISMKLQIVEGADETLVQRWQIPCKRACLPGSELNGGWRAKLEVWLAHLWKILERRRLDCCFPQPEPSHLRCSGRFWLAHRKGIEIHWVTPSPQYQQTVLKVPVSAGNVRILILGCIAAVSEAPNSITRRPCGIMIWDMAAKYHRDESVLQSIQDKLSLIYPNSAVPR